MTKSRDNYLRNLILEYLLEKEGYKDDEDLKTDAKALAEDCKYSVIENYSPDGPGWTGDILTVAWGSHEQIQNFIVDYENDELIEIA